MIESAAQALEKIGPAVEFEPERLVEWVRDFVSTNEFGPIAVVLAGVLVLFILYKILRGIFTLFSGGGGRSREVRRRRRDARRALAKKDYVGAGRTFMGIGEYEAAAEAYLKGGKFVLAGESYLKLGKYLEAARAFSDGGAHEKAGDLFEKSQRFEQAADAYFRAGLRKRVASLYERVGRLQKAAEVYQEIGELRKAAACWEKIEEPARAGAILAQLFEKEKRSLNPDKDDTKRRMQKQALRDLAVKAGELLLMGGKKLEAAGLLMEGGRANQAGIIYRELEKWQEAGEAFDEAGELERASACFEKTGQADRAMKKRAEHLEKNGELPGAAELYEKAGEYEKAAQIQRGEKQFARAAELYSKAGNMTRAAENYAMAGDFVRAGVCYEKVRSYKMAADCFRQTGDQVRVAEIMEKGGNYLDAGTAYVKAGEPARAVEALRKVKSNDFKNYHKAAIMIAKIHRDENRLDEATRFYEAAIKDRPLDDETVDAHYELASIYADASEFQQARIYYERILSYDYNYKDVTSRLEELRQLEITQTPVPPQAVQSKLKNSSRSQTGQFVAERYHLIEKIGKGGMGVVYKCRDAVLDRIVAYKEIRFLDPDDDQAIDNFLREAKSAAAMNHENIVTLHDVGRADDKFYIIMEYVDGRDLRSIIKERGLPMSISEGVSIAVQAAGALAYAHDQHLVHRDIKSANLMISKKGAVKILDFGLARMVEEVTQEASKVLGTPAYMSPEQIQGHEVDHRTDIYSLGIALFEVFTGELPFKEGNFGYHHVNTPPPVPKEINPAIPASISRVILRCLEKDRDQRFQSAKEIVEELKQ